MIYSTLNNGIKMPQLGIGVYLVPSQEIAAMLDTAFKVGYRSIDTANFYVNEVAVGKAMAVSHIKREDFFLTSKIWPKDFGPHKTARAIDDTLKRLDVDYLDLLLLHQQFGDYVGAWKVMETYVKAGKIKSIGVSNFDIATLIDLISKTDILPVLNQVECHPYYQQDELKAYMKQHHIKLEAWYPIGHGHKKLFKEPLLIRLSEKYNRTVAQIMLKWHLQVGHIIIPKSTNPIHMKENFELFDFKLTAKEIKDIKQLNKSKPLLKIPKWLMRLVLKLYKPNFDKQR